KTGIGIWIEQTATHSVIAGVKKGPTTLLGALRDLGAGEARDEAIIRNFNYGIEDDASDTIVEFFHQLNDNKTAGLYLNNVTGVTAGNFCADKNGVAGVLAVNTNSSRLFDFTAEQNTLEGLLLQKSNNNSVFNMTALLNSEDGLLLQDSSNNSLSTGS